MRRALFDTGKFLIAVVVLGLICPAASEAAGPGQTPDADYPLLGEYSGPISFERNKYEPLALQVRPIGGGNFEAIQYEGGLPGEKTFRGKPVKFIGRRSGDFLVLSGGPWVVIVEKDHCLVLDREGEKLGRLDRVERESPTMGATAPKDAIVLFDGSGTDQFTTAEMTPEGLLTEGADMKPMFQDFNLHLEFLLPYMPSQLGQGRANSGVYLQSRYEVQVLDSFAEEPTNNGCGGLYKFREPDVNMCLPPLTWQTYDIEFTAPRWAADGSKVRNARITVWLNGVKVHDNLELPGKTGAGKPEEPLLLPTRLQDHGNPVRYRNIWLIDRGLTPAARFPVYPPKPEPKPQPKPEAKEEPNRPEPAKAEGKPEAKPEAKPEPKPKTEPKSEPKPKPEAKPQEQKQEPKPQPKAEEKKADKPEKVEEKPAAPETAAEEKPASAPEAESGKQAD